MPFGLMMPAPYPRGIVALREKRRHQSSTAFCLKKKPFARLVREVIQDVAPGYKLKHEAIDALQVSLIIRNLFIYLSFHENVSFGKMNF